MRQESRTRHTRARRAFKSVLLVLATVLVCIAVGEGVVRIVYGPKFGRRPGFFVGGERVGWKPAPNLHHTYYGPDYEVGIRTDADGYRLGMLGEVDYTKDLVVLCGDSFAFGWGVSTGESFASYEDSILSAGSHGQMRLINLGVGGYGIFQSCDRLGEFFATHPDARVRTVILQHSVNDATDNVYTLGYHLGIWETEPLKQTRSRWHLVNLTAYALQAARQVGHSRPKVRAIHPYLQDVFWSYRRKGARVPFPSSMRFGNRQVTFEPREVKRDTNADSLVAREALSRGQRDLMLAALDCVHQGCATMRVPVVHTFVSTTPRWYVAELQPLVEESADSTHCNVVITGPVPLPDEFPGPMVNAHSGGHFTPGFNRFWAIRMADILREAVGNDAPRATPVGAGHR